jgi:hypothetical protein
MKGMATYSNDIPDGYDFIYNTNKKLGTPPNKVYKEMDLEHPDNPFGAVIKRQNYYEKDGKEVQGALNVVREEGEWTQWSKNLPAQFLAKQSDALAKQQLDLDYKNRKGEYEDICKLTNPVVKAALLERFSDGCDGAAVKLKTASLTKQAYYVLMPLTDLKENEIYAPNFKDGEQVALVRHPHAGRFEIPILTVNNNSKDGERVIGKNSPDAVGINAKTAAILSGADFDGDTVLVIPTKGTNLKAQGPLKGLKDFEPKDQYRAYPGMPETCKKNGFNKQQEMGNVSNLITDMTIKGASDDELARAVRHSMVVIDAEKHNLDWRRSARENGISELKAQYQGGPRSGASTLISQA